ncbi:DMT family transporter [Vulcanisaeta souniana]|uniref:Transporter n=1 Tax=Vulcanisaeta souniana JCM 11219 TaxID=1293586 RepID=A0ABN6SR60_9CREN|nr:DMT family transporter [Vulcanisaeta souniana]BDR91302.1 transporter [Vulcanisaeta souniana JCM 11219]
MIIEDLPALSTAIIWAWASIMYGDFMKRMHPLTVNFLRMLYTSVILLIPAMVLGLNYGAIWGSLSGLLSLVIGDSLYLFSINYSGVSIAAPASYTYIPLTVLFAVFLGEPLTITKLMASILLIPGVYLLSRGGGSRREIKGLFLGLSAAVAWSAGQTMIKIADTAGLNPISIAFTRVAAAGIVLFVVNRLMGSNIAKAVRGTVRGYLPIIAVLDLGLGVALFALSMDLIGLGLTVILTGTMPLIAQAMSSTMGRERFSILKFLGALIIVVAIILVVL